jgi:glycosyltransferase involved in cell wall biosynthesis
MDKKRRIGIIYRHDNNWIGGKYYIDSIICALKEKNSFFDLFILSLKKDKNTKYGFIKYRINIFDRIIGKFRYRLPLLVNIYLSIFYKKRLSKLYDLDVIFPAQSNLFFDKLPDSKKIFWIPDFQENRHPDFFKKYEIVYRIFTQVNIAYSKSWLVLSSVSAYNDFIRLYPYHHCGIRILSFVSSLCFYTYELPDRHTIVKKYNIDSEYYICSNQFFMHKNHTIILEAVFLLKKNDINIKVYFTGKEYDYRNPGYALNIRKKVADLGLENNIFFLGFVSRDDQVVLMKHAKAVIQPSLFEGWNTTIEDAKYLGKEIIASDIEVHREQLGDNGQFFNPNNPIELAEIIKSSQNKSMQVVDYSYLNSYENFKNLVTEIFS